MEAKLEHRLNYDLMHWLDDAVEKSIRAGRVKAIVDRKDPAKLVDITEHLGAPAFVVVKRNSHKNSDFAETIVTVLDEKMKVEHEENRWESCGQLQQQLARLPAGTAVKKMEPAAPTPPLNGSKMKNKEPAVASDCAEYLISYVGEQGVAYELVPKEELSARVAALAMDPDVETETLRAWREVPLNIRVQVDIGG
jgi:hypothetical protein